MVVLYLVRQDLWNLVIQYFLLLEDNVVLYVNDVAIMIH